MAYTGGKYASTTITTVGTTTVTASGAAFVSTDFAAQRIVGLWNSAGTTFLGMAYVRSWVSATQLQLETAFFDPATGATVAQATGQIILVSKNFTDISGTGVTVTAPNQATFTAAPVFGTANTSTGVCFYDEGYEIVCPYSIEILGGLTVFGHISNPVQATIGTNTYASGTISGPCNIDFGTLAGTSDGIYTGDATSNFVMYGGTLNGQNSPIYNGGYLGTAGYTFIFNYLQSPFDLISPGAGGTWGTNALRMQLVNCISISTATNAICRRWGDGLQVGGVFKFPNNTTAPLSALGSDTNGTYTFAAPAGQRAYVLDFGGNSTGTSATGAPILVRTNHSGNTITFNITNLIASNYYSGYGGSPAAANTSGINNVYFQDTFSNLISTTVGVIQLSGTAVASALATGTSWSPSLLYETVTGFTTTTGPNTSWTYGLKAYGYQVVSGTIAASTYSLGTAGSAPNVSWQTAVNQLSDTSLAATGISQSTANGYTSLANLDQLYAASVNWGTLSVANAQLPTLSQYPITYSGSQLNLGSYNLVINSGTTSAGNAFAISGTTMTIYAGSLAPGTQFTSFTSTGTVTVSSGVTITTPFTTTGAVTNNGTINAQYTSSAGTTGVLTLNNLVSGSSVYIVPNNGQPTQSTASSGTTQTYYIPPNSGATQGTWKVALYGKLPVTGTFTSNSTSTATVTQNTDTGLTNPLATVTTWTSLNSPDEVYDYAAYWETLTTVGGGISYTRVTTKSGSQLSFGSTNVTLSTTASSIYTITSGNPVIKSASTFTLGTTYNSFATSGTVTLSGLTYGSTLLCAYISSAGASTVFSLTGLPYSSSSPLTSSVYITNSSGVQQGSVLTTTSGSINVYIAPQSSATWNFKVACYTYFPQTGTFSVGSTSNLYPTQAVTLGADTGYTNSLSTVQSWISVGTLSTPDQVYDYAAYWETTSAGIPYTRVTTGDATNLSFGSTAVTLSTTASSMYAITSGNPVIKSASSFTPGTTYTAFVTSSTVTLSGLTFSAGSLTCPYTSSGGSTTILTLSGLPSATGYVPAVSVVNNSGTQYKYISTASSTQAVYIGLLSASATWTWKVACYGNIAGTGSFTAGSTNYYQSAIVSLATDTGITQPVTNLSTVSGYTTFSNPDQMYDYLAYWETTNNTGGIMVSRPASKNGTSVSFGSNNLVFSSTTGTTYAYSAGSPNTLSFKTAATFTAGSTYSQFNTSGTLTLTSVTVTCIYTTGSGTSAVLTLNGLVSGSSVYVQNASAVQQSYVTGITSGTYTLSLGPGSSAGTWTWATKALGYDSQIGTFTPSSGGLTTLTVDTPQKLQPSGGAMYTGSTNSLCTISFNGLSEADILIGNGQVSVQNVFDISENALVNTAAGMAWLAGGLGELTEYLAPTGNYLFMTHLWRLKALNTSSPNASLLGYPLSTDGTPINSANGTIIIFSSTQSSDVAAAVWNAVSSSYTTSGTMGQQLNLAEAAAALAAALSA